MNPAYRNVVIRVEGKIPSCDFSIVTACNPKGQINSKESNRQADQKLRDALADLTPPPLRATGMSPDQSHQEPGWTVWDLDESIRLGREFQQEAIYRVTRGTLHLIALNTEIHETLGPLKDFLVH